MSYEHPGGGVLDYQLCRYGESRVLFRGPRQRLVPPYVVFFGGSETFGRFVREPFPDLTARALGMRGANMGCVNAGPDVFASDPVLLAAAARATATVIQLPGAHNLSNHFYTVHPRRNDRFIAASEMLMRLYPEIDFTEYSFTRHMLGALEEQCSDRFGQIVDELQASWLNRMRLIVREAGQHTVLLWMSDAPPPESARSIRSGQDPLFVDLSMVAQLTAKAEALVEVIPTAPARGEGLAGMVHSEFEAPVAQETIGPAVHEEISKALVPALRRLGLGDR